MFTRRYCQALLCSLALLLTPAVAARADQQHDKAWIQYIVNLMCDDWSDYDLVGVFSYTTEPNLIVDSFMNRPEVKAKKMSKAEVLLLIMYTEKQHDEYYHLRKTGVVQSIAMHGNQATVVIKFHVVGTVTDPDSKQTVKINTTTTQTERWVKLNGSYGSWRAVASTV